MADGLSYNHQTVSLDGEAFNACEFSNCKLIYSGGPVPQFNSCGFTDCDWTFQGAAADTLEYLKLIWSVGAKTAVQATIKEITVAAK
jgi:hypothetical protein